MNLIPSLFLLTKQHKQLCLWPSSSCNNHPKTISFRAPIDHHFLFINPNKHNSLLEAAADQTEVTTLGSCFSNSSDLSPCSISTDSYSSAVETIVNGAKCEQRLFFEPESTSSLLEVQESEKENINDGLVFKESEMVVMETQNPYGDFKKSMEEMVEIYGLKEWDCLEELLGWYLRMNDKDQHEFIVGAFFDLLVGINCHGGDHDHAHVSCLDHHHCIHSLTSDVSSCSSPISSPNAN
ncbi:hypothetical protein QVD17_36241 [Tagetes erecta]|uniref:Transcription repressor n=1 Tax=Tagetes erecta TaxID=13708 RepID=A0AAD8NHY6_TARER|nr:hypothetical protein QVD17_36241 [Tagetes erecta]